MSTVKKGLLPTSLPPLSHTDSVSRSLNTSDPNKYVPYNSIVSSQKSINSNTILTGTTGIVKGRKTNSAPIRTDSHSIAESGITLEEEYDEDFNDHEELEQAAVQKRRTPKLIVESYDSADIDNLSGIVSINKDGSVDDSLEEEDLVLISSRPFPVMGDTVKNFEHKNCLVMVYTSKQYDENLYFKVMSAGISNQLLHERSLSIDSAYEIINYANETSQIIHSSDQEDLQILSSLLIDMFKAADVDNSGKPLLLSRLLSFN